MKHILRKLIMVTALCLPALLWIPFEFAHAEIGAEHENMALVGHHPLHGRSAYQPVIQEHAGRRIAYVGHHRGSALNPLTGKREPNGTSIVDVSDPAHPVYLHHIPGAGGAQMAQTCRGRDLPAKDDKVYLLRSNGDESHEVWDVTNPRAPVRISTPLSGGHATHKNWWDCDTGIAYLVYDGRQLGWKTRRLLWVVDLGDPTNPRVIRQFGLSGQQPGAHGFATPPGAHEATLSPDGKRLFIAYGTGHQGIMQIVDVRKLLGCRPNCPARPTVEELLYAQVGRLDMPRFWGAHTAWPVLGIPVVEQAKFIDASPRDFVVLVSESFASGCQEDAHDMVFLVDISDENRPFPVSNYQVRESQGAFCDRGGRFGAHSMNWSYHPGFYKKLIVVSYFNAGARVVDIRDPFHPKEVGFYIPATASREVAQTNNVEIDARGLIYLADRAGAGLHIVKLTGIAAQIVRRTNATPQ